MSKYLPILVGVVIVIGIILIGVRVLNTKPVGEETTNNETTGENVINDEIIQDEPFSDNLDSSIPLELTMEMSNYDFSPSVIRARPGQEVILTLVGVQGEHDFVIDLLGVSSRILGDGQNGTVTFTIPENAVSGTTYEFYCSLEGHRALGMTGTLTII